MSTAKEGGNHDFISLIVLLAFTDGKGVPPNLLWREQYPKLFTTG
jgi:hypothetical protein